MNPLSCSQCGAVNASDARVCYQCKKILSIGAHSICDSCYHRNPLHLANCVNCGMELTEAEELEKESVMAFENSATKGTAPLALPNTGELSPEPLAQNDDADPSFYEAKTKKHKIPEFEIDTPELIENSTSEIEPAATQTDIMDNEKDISKMHENEQDQSAAENLTSSSSNSNEDVDILSMLDLDLTQDKFPSEPPRQISEDQIQPTDWINELVPSTDELPTMADMLPEPTAPNTSEDGMPMPSSVMDLLFGDTESVDKSAEGEQSPEPPTVPNMEIRDQENIEVPAMSAFPVVEETEEVQEVATTDAIIEPEIPVTQDTPVVEANSEVENSEGWLSDALTDLDDSSEDLFDQSELSQEELPDWMDFDLDPADQLSPESVEKTELAEEPQNFLESPAMPDEEDALDWLTDDSANKNVTQAELPEQLNTMSQDAPVANHNGTRDLSESAFSEKAIELSEAVDASGISVEEANATQANLPNWIKEMAPDSEAESVGIATTPESDNSQMDDDALSAILDSIGVDSEESIAPIFEEQVEIAPVETAKPEFDFSKTPEPSEEELLREAISAIESEIQEIKGAPVEKAELLPEAELSEPTSTKDLPDWLQSPQTSPLNPEDLGFIESKIEESRAISADQMAENPAEEISNIISENILDEPNTPDVDNEIAHAPVDASDQLAQFDWGDVESVFEGKPDTPAEIETPVAPSYTEFNEPEEIEPETIDSAVELAAFDWLQDTGAPSFDEPQEINTSEFADLNLEPLENISIGTPHDIEESISEVESEIDAVVPDLETDLNTRVEMPKMEEILGIEAELPNAGADLGIDDIVPDIGVESGLDDLNISPLPDTILQDPAEAFGKEAEDIIEQANKFGSIDGLGINGSSGTTDNLPNSESFEPLKEFHDESDVFATVRDQPPVENSIFPESLKSFETGPIELPDQEIADSFSLDSENQSADDFFSALAEENNPAEMPAWADELVDGSKSATENMPEQDNSDANPLAGIDDVVGIAPSISNQVSEIQNLHTPQMMEPIAHRKRARMAAQAAGTVPMTDPTQPVVVPKERQKYQPRFNATQFDGRPNLDKKKRSRQVGFLVVAGVLTLAVLIAVTIPFLLRLFN